MGNSSFLIPNSSFFTLDPAVSDPVNDEPSTSNYEHI